MPLDDEPGPSPEQRAEPAHGELTDEIPPELATPGLLAKARGVALDLTPLRRSRQFRLLWIGEVVSDLGTQFASVALPFQVFQITRSSLAVGMLALCGLVPLLILPVIGGALADRVERRRLLLISYSLVPLLPLALLVNSLLDRPHLWVLYAVETLYTASYALWSPAIRSLPPLVVSKDLLPSVNALMSAYASTGALLGPALGGALIAVIGLPGTYALDVASFGVALVMLASMRPIPPVPGEHHERGLWRSIGDGIRFLRGRKVLQTTYTVDLIAMIFGMPRALFPAFAVRLGGGPGILGLLYAAPYAGSTLITLFSGWAKRVRRQGLATEIAVVVWGAALVGFGLSRTTWLALLFLAVAGAGDMWSGIFRTTIGQTVVSDDLRGRLEGMGLAVWATGPALGDVEAGVVGSVVGLPFAIVSGGLGCIAGVVILAFLVPQFHRYDAAHPSA
jgi:hypothetical protein